MELDADMDPDPHSNVCGAETRIMLQEKGNHPSVADSVGH